MARSATIRIVHPSDPDDYLIIDATAFDPETMREWTDAPPPPPKDPAEPTDPAERGDAIVAAIRQIDRDDEEAWTNAGKPSVAALDAILGWEPKGAERDEAWARVEAE